MVVYAPYLMGRSEKLWGADALTFNIHRWFSPVTGEPVREPSFFKLPVFQAGPRLCLGKAAAMGTVMMMLSRIVKEVSQARTSQRHPVCARLFPLSISHARLLAAVVSPLVSVRDHLFEDLRHVRYEHRTPDQRWTASATAQALNFPSLQLPCSRRSHDQSIARAAASQARSKIVIQTKCKCLMIKRR
jgi:hypothetical protein